MTDAATAPATCKYCERPVLSRGMCTMHYKRWQKGADLTAPARTVNVGRTCSVDGCLRAAVVRGMCKMHDKRVRNKGEAGPPQRLRWQYADMCFCGLPAGEGGLCGAHAVISKESEPG